MVDDEPSRIGRVLTLLVVGAIVAMWLYIFSGAPREDPPDRLDDESFALAAQPLCADARAEIDALPPAGSADSAAERADVIDEANDTLDRLVADLAAIETTTDRDDELVTAWLADWRTYVDDRRDFADALRDDPEAELLVTARGGRQITLTIDRFAEEANDMPACATPLDV